MATWLLLRVSLLRVMLPAAAYKPPPEPTPPLPPLPLCQDRADAAVAATGLIVGEGIVGERYNASRYVGASAGTSTAAAAGPGGDNVAGVSAAAAVTAYSPLPPPA